MLVLAVIAPAFATHDPYAIDLKNVTAAPSSEFIMGTDYEGRCIACRLLYGASRSILSAFIVVAATLVIGTFVGIVCGYVGGLFDTVVMRFVDAVQAFPDVVFAIAVAAMLGGGMENCIIALTAVGWTSYARLARSRVLAVKDRSFVAAARIAGASRLSLLVKTVLPNCLTPLVVSASMHVGSAILSFAGLSFLGLGSAPPFPEWGTMLSDGRATLQQAPWTVFFPGFAILCVVMIMGMFGDSVNEMLNPKPHGTSRAKRRRLKERFSRRAAQTVEVRSMQASSVCGRDDIPSK